MSDPSAPRYSVILPVHQGEIYLGQALESLAAQRHPGLEVIAVDDASTDRSREILEQWRDRLPLRILTPESGGNWMAATNAGLREARGEWIGFLHQDDRWHPARLAALDAAVSAQPGVRFFCHSARFIGPDDRPLGRWRTPWPSGRTLSGSEAFARYTTQNFLAIPAPCVHRDVVNAAGPLREDLWFLADWEFWLRCLHHADTWMVLPDVLADFRIHPRSQTATRSTSEDDLRRQFREIRNLVAELHGGHPALAASRVNEDLTVSLANRSHGLPGCFAKVLTGFLDLGPAGWIRFWRDSRIAERLIPRLRLAHRNTRPS